MLIIAIPKSASTSLLATIGKRQDKEKCQIIFPGLEIPSDYNILGNYHSDIRNYPLCLLKLFSTSSVIFKQHIPPTKEHMHCLASHKKVILLRTSLEIIDAYRRAELKKLHSPRKEFKGALEQNAWRSRAEEIGLKKELDQFYNMWDSVEDNHTLIIQYTDLIQSPTDTFRSIEKFWNLPSSTDTVTLAKERYSGNGSSRLFLKKVCNTLKAVKRELLD